MSRRGASASASPIVTLGAAWWYDSKDLTSTGQQSTLDRITLVNALTHGSTAGSDTNDPTVVLTTRNYWNFDRVDDYLQHPAADTPTFTGTTGAFSLIACAAPDTSATMVLWSSEGVNDRGAMLLFEGGIGFRVRVGAAAQVVSHAVGSGTAFDGTTRCYGLVVTPGSPSTFVAYERVAGFSGPTNIGTAPIHGAPRIGTRASLVGSAPYGAKVFAVVGFNTALSLLNMNTVSDYLLAGSYS